MPELPDLEVIKDVLARRMAGAQIVSVHTLRPLIVRNLVGGEISEHLVGQTVDSVKRRGKFLLLTLSNGLSLVINPMLAGRLRFGEPLPKDRRRDALIISFASGQELRYFDPKDMGKVYLTENLGAVPGFDTMGPEANDPSLTVEIFAERLSVYRGEIKSILTRQDFVAGIGTAYSDEILWRAGIYPYRRRTSLTSEEVRSVHEAIRSVLGKRSGFWQQGWATRSRSSYGTSWASTAAADKRARGAGRVSARFTAAARAPSSAGNASLAYSLTPGAACRSAETT